MVITQVVKEMNPLQGRPYDRKHLVKAQIERLTDVNYACESIVRSNGLSKTTHF